MKVYKKLSFVLVVLFLLVASCTPKGRAPQGMMDNPLHHYKQGVAYLDEDKLDLAEEEFEQALSLDPDYGPALAGKGLIQVIKGDRDGLKLITKGQQKAKGKEEKIWTLVSEIRAYIALKKQKKLSDYQLITKAKEAFSRGNVIKPNSPELYFYLGEAYLYGLDFYKAEEMYAKVKSLGDKDWEERADLRWQLAQKANRAAPESQLGKEIVLVDKLTRGDLAGLLIEELNVKRFYTKTQEAEKKTFEAPQGVQMKFEDIYTENKVKDIANHPLKNDILMVVDLGVRGLQPYPDHTFRPNEPVSKVEMALLFEDILIRATGNNKLATEFIGQESNIPDIPTTHYAFNAVMLCTTRGLLSTDIRSGEFYPDQTISGVDAVLAIKKLKDMLRLF